MYFPYIRGRQYELLALKELVTKDLICAKVVPIIEPVKLSSTLINTILEYIRRSKQVGVIQNPGVGNFVSECRRVQADSKEDTWCKTFEEFFISGAVIPSLLMNIDTKRVMNGHEIKKTIIIHNDPDFIDDYEVLFKKVSPRYTLMPDEGLFRRTVVGERVLFGDKFSKKIRNADYAKKDDELFSVDHLYFAAEGYSGFSDYSVIGNDYVESGFAPYAVAIHIVYFDDLKKLRIRHFVSDSNDDIENPAGKYYEALSKLVAWYDKETNPPKTFGVETFLDHYQKQTYPGLGTVKKLALMHHIELVSQFFEE